MGVSPDSQAHGTAVPGPDWTLFTARSIMCAAALLLAQAVDAAGIPRSPSPSTPISHSDPLLKQQGGDAGANFGDYVSNSDGSADGGTALDSAYRYYIEVPAGASRLVVDIFDADVGAGGFGEADEGRDRARGGDWDTSVDYRLYDPDGNQVGTEFNTGDSSGPAGADNAWLNLYDSSASTGGGGFVQSTTAQDASATALSINFGPVPNDDLLVAALVKQGNGGSIGTPTGWSLIDQGPCPSGNFLGSCRMAVFYRVADGSQGTGVTINISGGPVALAGAVLQYTDIDTSAPLDVSGSNTGVSASPTAPSVVTSAANTRVVRIVGARNSLSAGAPAGHTGRHIVNQDCGFICEVSSGSADAVQGSAGATGSASFSYSNGFPAAWRTVTVAFRTEAATTAPAAGHWRLEVDSSDSGGDDIVAYGVRAHDGDLSSGGTELAVYAEPYLTFGINDESGDTDTLVAYPYLSGGCTVDSNDFDMDDNNSGDQGQIIVDTRQGSTVLNVDDPAMSNNDEWNSEGSSAFDTNPFQNTDHGIGRVEYAVSDFPGNSNYTLWYLSDPDTTDIPPDSIDEPSFRVYFPPDGADDDDAPVKPYLEQELTYVSGTNPPAAGETTVVQITVRLVNPTAHAIAFSGSDVVTSRVPSNGRVSYVGGSWQASTGSLAGGEPSDGASGVDVDWNAGTVAAGATEIMTYQVYVTPQAANETIYVTGQTPANGTRATWLDETANSSQPRATFTFGQLCGLSVTADASITYVSLSSFRAYSDGPGARVEWETSSEAGTAGFVLRRFDPRIERFRRVPGGRVRALLTSPAGGTYSVIDPDAASGQSYTYRLIEIQTNGRRRAYGPFTVTVDGEPAEFDAGPAQRTAGAAESGRSGRRSSPDAGRRAFDHRGRQPELDEDWNEFEAMKEWARESRDARRAHRKRSERSKRRAQRLRQRLRQAREQRRFTSGEEVKVTVTETGLYEVTASDIAALLGRNENTVRRAIQRGGLHITNRNRTVRYRALDGGRSLVFFGESVDSPYTDENVYWIKRGRVGGNQMRRQGHPETTARDDGPARASRPGRRWGRALRRGFGPIAQNRGVNGLRTTDSEAEGTQSPEDPLPEPGRKFMESMHVEKDIFAGPVVPVNRGQSFWYWKVLAYGGSGTFEVPTPGVTSSGQAVLSVRAQGAVSGPGLNENGAIIQINNGAWVGSGEWDDATPHRMTFEVPQSVLSASNQVEVTSSDSGAFYFDGFDIEYKRNTTAVDGALLVDAGEFEALAVDGFATDRVHVYDVSDPKAPAFLPDVTVEVSGGGYEAVFPTTPGGTYLVLEADRAREPASLSADSASSLRSPRNRADYLVIAPELLKSSAQKLAGYRGSEGMLTQVVLLEDLYDEFNAGLADPHAVRRFLGYAYHSWRQAPRYVVFLGKGTYDYQDAMDEGTNLFPPIVMSTPDGMYAADGYALDVSGGDGVPEFAGGRIPATSDEEFDAYFDKLVAAEGYAGGWGNNVVVSAEDRDPAADFKADARALVGLLNGQNATEVYLDDLGIDQAREDLYAALNDAGASVYVHVGHGGMDRLASQGLVVTADVGNPLSNAGRLPFLVALSCLINRYEVPGIDPVLGEELILSPDAGAAAVWAPTGLSGHAGAAVLGEELFRSLYGNGTGRAGDAVVDALSAYRDATSTSASQFYVYTLLGDPAARIAGQPVATRTGPRNDTFEQGRAGISFQGE